MDARPPIAPGDIRYIKLGQGGSWARASIERGELHFGYASVPHEICERRDWDAVSGILAKQRKNAGKVKDGVREVRDFYTLGPDCLWINFADGHLYWAFAEPEVKWNGTADLDGGSRIRRTVDGWHRTNLVGQSLTAGSLSTRLTQLAAYRGTICTVKPADYLLRRINGIDEPVIQKAQAARSAMAAVAQEMIAGLHWADFETLVDLIFARAGWQRSSRVGENLTDVDLVLTQPATGETAFVQVKSKANQVVLDDYLDRFTRDGTFDRFFFVCHSPRSALVMPAESKLHLWAEKHLADVAVRAGLFDWLIERSA